MTPFEALKQVLRSERRKTHPSDLYHFCVVSPENPKRLSHMILYEYLYSEALSIVTCPFLQYEEAGRGTEPLLKLYTALKEVLSKDTSFSSSVPLQFFVCQAWKGETEPVKLDQPNWLYEATKPKDLLAQLQEILGSNLCPNFGQSGA